MPGARLIGEVVRVVEQISIFHRQKGSMPRTGRFAMQLLKRAGGRLRASASAKAEAPEIAPHIAADLSAFAPKPLIAVLVTGGLGDYIVVARFMRDLTVAVEDFRFDLYCPNPEMGRWAFASLTGLNKVYHELLFHRLFSHYPLALRANQIVWIHDSVARWDLLAANDRLIKACAHLMKARAEFETCIDRHPYMDHHLANRVVFMGRRRENFLHSLARIPYRGALYPLPMEPDAFIRHSLPARFVTINNGFDTGFIITGRSATKCYPHGDELVRLFKLRFPDIAVVQLGSKNSVPIAGADHDLIEKTTLPEVVAILRRALLHIDNEGGLVHIAACLGTASAVLFGPTPIDYFGYPENINIGPAGCGNCWWINKTWMDICPLGHQQPPCLYGRSPESVVDRITLWLEDVSSSDKNSADEVQIQGEPAHHAGRKRSLDNSCAPARAIQVPDTTVRKSPAPCTKTFRKRGTDPEAG